MLLINNIIILIQSIYIVFTEYIKYKLKINNYVKSFTNVTQKLSDLNMLYTKILQWIINDSIYENNEMKKIIENYSNNVKYEESDIDYPSLFKLINNNKIKLLSLKPINSGTISLVYRGIMNKDKQIVIKILKKNIKNRLIESIKFFIFLSKICKYIPYLNKFNLDKIIKDINDKLILQIDFVSEIKNIKQFNNNFKNNRNITIPTPYDKYTIKNNNIIVMDYIDGINIYSIDNNDRLEYLKILYEFMFECMFNYKIFHSDLHPGNILFIKDNKSEDNKYKLGIIDYGIVEEYDESMKQKVCIFFKKLVKGNDKDLYEYIVNILGENVNSGDIITDIQKENSVNDLLIMKQKYNILTSNVKANDIYYINCALNKNNMILDIKFSKVFLIISSMYSLLYILQLEVNRELFKECFKEYCSNYIFTYINFIE